MKHEVSILMTDILIIDPDMRTGLVIRQALSEAGHTCTAVQTVADGMEALQSGGRMLCIINARLPWTGSIGLLRMLEERGWPVLFTTADAASVDHLQALYQGNCSVLLAPYDASALLEKVQHLSTVTTRTLTAGSLRLNTVSREATLDGEHLDLTAQEFALLLALMQSPETALSREELLRTAWGYQGIGETRTVDVHVQRLRRKLGSSCIETVYKHGYRLKMA